MIWDAELGSHHVAGDGTYAVRRDSREIYVRPFWRSFSHFGFAMLMPRGTVSVFEIAVIPSRLSRRGTAFSAYIRYLVGPSEG